MIGPDDLEAFNYWTPDEVDFMEKPKSVQEMVTEYRITAGQPLNIKTTDDYSDYSFCGMSWSLIEEEWKELNEELNKQTGINEEKALKEFADLVYVLYSFCAFMGWNLDEAVRRVHENNMARMYQDDGTIKRRGDGKIIKNPNTRKPDLSDLT